MAADEQEAEPVVLDRLRIAGVRGLLIGQEFDGPIATEAIDRHASGDGIEPRGRAIRHAIAIPRLEGPCVRFLQRVFGRVEIASQPDQPGQHGRALGASDAIEQARQEHGSELTGANGRISTVPSLIPGMRSAHSIA